MGHHGLRDHVRRLSAARWARGRPARSSARVHRRRRAVHARLARLRTRPERRDADRFACRPGTRRGDHLAGRPVDRDDELRRRGGAQQGARRVGRARRERCRGRRARRRHPHGVPQLALDLLRERARRRARAALDAADRSREPARRHGTAVRRARRRSRQCRPRAARLHDLPGAERRLGECADDPAADLVGSTAGRIPRERTACPRSVDAFPHLSRAHGCRGKRRRLLTRSRDLRELLLADAVRPGHPRLLGAEDRPDVPRHRGHCRPRSRSGAGA